MHLPEMKAWLSHSPGWFLSQPVFPHFLHLKRMAEHVPIRRNSLPWQIILSPQVELINFITLIGKEEVGRIRKFDTDENPRLHNMPWHTTAQGLETCVKLLPYPHDWQQTIASSQIQATPQNQTECIILSRGHWTTLGGWPGFAGFSAWQLRAVMGHYDEAAHSGSGQESSRRRSSRSRRLMILSKLTCWRASTSSP